MFAGRFAREQFLPARAAGIPLWSLLEAAGHGALMGREELTYSSGQYKCTLVYILISSFH